MPDDTCKKLALRSGEQTDFLSRAVSWVDHRHGGTPKFPASVRLRPALSIKEAGVFREIIDEGADLR